ncbi:MAG: aminotransferase class I/II-fold pyridoxal phosphate-dependent enzyme [Thermoleophilia bacterium]|nr:aminotransferase class I/II-fold pyridoxal phosphate-dependent enzyme [Thermoleophilia bacterium]
MRPEPFALERYFARYEFTARYLLASSDCDGLPMAEVLAAADDECAALWHDLTLAYTESLGLPQLRAEIARLYDTAGPDDVLTGAPQELIFVAMLALLSPGDHVVCTFPAYQSLHQVAETIGCEVTRWMPREREAWRLHPADLEACLRPETRLVVVNVPHNPTGALPSHADWQAVTSLVAAHGARLFCDEMYRGLELDPGDRLPAAADVIEGAISLSGMSKVYGMAGTRIGWLTVRDEETRSRIAAMKDSTAICSSAPSEVLALIGLRNGPALIARHRARVERNLAALDAFFDRRADLFSWVRPRAGTVCLARLRDEALSVEALALKSVEEAGIMLTPGTLFGLDDSYLRIGFGRENLPTVLERFEEFLAAAYPPR